MNDVCGHDASQFVGQQDTGNCMPGETKMEAGIVLLIRVRVFRHLSNDHVQESVRASQVNQQVPEASR